LPDDQAHDILQKVQASTIADVTAPDKIVAVLRAVLRAWADDNLQSLAPDLVACRAYSAEIQTRALVAALEGAPAFGSICARASRCSRELYAMKLPQRSFI
jgi:hypothetical protein